MTSKFIENLKADVEREKSVEIQRMVDENTKIILDHVRKAMKFGYKVARVEEIKDLGVHETVEEFRKKGFIVDLYRSDPVFTIELKWD
jgi:hypothetical protein